MDTNHADKIAQTHLLPTIAELYGLNGYKIEPIPPDDAGDYNLVYLCEKEHIGSKVIRIAYRNSKTRDDFFGETEFVRHLYKNGGSVSNVICSLNGNMAEEIVYNNHSFFVCMFERAKGIKFAKNGYKYREGVSISEYFYNSGKVLGKLHELAKNYSPVHRRHDYLDKYTTSYINNLIPKSLSLAKEKIFELVKTAAEMSISKSKETYGMIHYDYHDENYCIDFETGDITVFDFDESCFGWYMLDIAHLWLNGFEWAYSEPDASKRKKIMDDYFAVAIAGYRSETNVSDSTLGQLPVFLKIFAMETIMRDFEYMRHTGEPLECFAELSYHLTCLENDIPYWGFFHEIYSCESPFECEERITLAVAMTEASTHSPTAPQTHAPRPPTPVPSP